MTTETILRSIQTEGIRALAWKQPYASLMLCGKIETRTWPTHYRGWVLICTSRTQYDDNAIIAISGGPIADQIWLNVEHTRKEPYLGHAIAIGWLTDCRPMALSDERKTFVKYRWPWTETRTNKKTGEEKQVSKQLWCHIYDHVVPIEPFPYSNGQKWTKPTDEQIAMIKPIVK